jgi:hypothetical protein
MVTTIEVLWVIPVEQAVNGLGFNVSPGNNWKFRMAAAAGATHARFPAAGTGNETRPLPRENTHAATHRIRRTTECCRLSRILELSLIKDGAQDLNLERAQLLRCRESRVPASRPRFENQNHSV